MLSGGETIRTEDLPPEKRALGCDLGRCLGVVFLVHHDMLPANDRFLMSLRIFSTRSRVEKTIFPERKKLGLCRVTVAGTSHHYGG